MTKERYLFDSEIAASYRNHKITEAKMWGFKSGGMQIELPFNEDRWDNFIQYEDGLIAFDQWYPDEVYMKLVETAQDMIRQYKETHES